ncbi:MAG: FAD-dependent oxidoreductase [Candidatus Eremiobacteraeota bacterium]|nr:FAD-dependent oxidoreductase [Candidatus Eremiobacteraeota bacterium]
MREYLTSDRIVKSVVGLRPYRRGSLRLEEETLGPQRWLHNYGHGGSGITLCWGCAEWVSRRLKDCSESVAVLGAGAIGLSVAHRLLRQGLDVTVYARDFPPDTTSNVAGGLWAPTHLALPDENLRRDLLTWSWRAYQELEGDDYAVWLVKLYQGDSPYPLEPMPEWLVGEGKRARLPFGPNAPEGFIWNTYLIQTSTFLERLVDDIERAGGVLQPRTFSSVDEVSELPQRVVVNCLGLGAGALLKDDAVVPIRGQLLYLRPCGDRKMIVDHAGGYLISREDALILGGTFEEGVSNLTPDEEMSKKILKGNQSFDWD